MKSEKPEDYFLTNPKDNTFQTGALALDRGGGKVVILIHWTKADSTNRPEQILDRIKDKTDRDGTTYEFLSQSTTIVYTLFRIHSGMKNENGTQLCLKWKLILT